MLVRQVTKVAGIDGIALTKLDVLDGFAEIKVCIGYKLDGERLDRLARGAELAKSHRTRMGDVRRLEPVDTRGALVGRASRASRQVRASHRGADRVPGDAALDLAGARGHDSRATRSRYEEERWAAGRCRRRPFDPAYDELPSRLRTCFRCCSSVGRVCCAKFLSSAFLPSLA